MNESSNEVLILPNCTDDELAADLQMLWASNLLNSPRFNECLPMCGLCQAMNGTEGYIIFNSWLSGVVLPSLGILGLIGNALSAFVYSRPECRSNPTSLYLCALGCSDSAVILTAIFLFGVESYRKFSVHIQTVFAAVSPVVYPMGLAAQTTSVYFTLAAGVDCFVQTCLSKRVNEVFATRSFIHRTLLAIVVMCIIYNIPHCFESVVIACFSEQFQSSTLELCPDPLRFDETFNSIYYKFMYSTFVAVGPLIALIIMNLSIVCVTIYGKKRANSSNIGDTIALVLVVLLFIFCNTAALLLNMFEEYLSGLTFFNHLVDVSNLMVVFNSSFNFVIYVTFSQSFRETLIKYVQGRKLLKECCYESAFKSSLLQEIPVTGTPIVITEKGRAMLTKETYPHFIAAQQEVLI